MRAEPRREEKKEGDALSPAWWRGRSCLPTMVMPLLLAHWKGERERRGVSEPRWSGKRRG
jgi:hypothetical protein